MNKHTSALKICSNQMNFNINLTNFSKHIMEINNDNLIGTKRKFENEISKENLNPEQENKRSLSQEESPKPNKSKKIELKQISFVEFESFYNDYLEDNRFLKVTHNIKEEFLNIKDLVFEVLIFTSRNGGFAEVIGYNKLQLEFIKTSEKIKEYSKAREILDKYVFHFIKYMEIRNRKNADVEKIVNLSPEFVKEIPGIYVSNKATKEEIEDCFKDTLEYDLVFAKKVLNKMKINKDYFTTSYLENNYPDLVVDVIEQSPNFTGFSFNWHTKKRWKMKDYIKYVNIQENNDNVVHIKREKLIKLNQILKDMIYYCVNVDLDDYPEIKECLDKNLPSSIKFRGSNDLLSHLRTIVKGMTSPQIYIKVTGTWTGGHEENLRFRSINMNHGPGDSDWYGVGMKDSLKFRELVKKQHNMDIYKKEGIWFPTLDWFMTNKIEVFYGVQEMHDVCIVGVGCLHWVRARNHSINSSWNFGSKDLLQIKSSYERFEINKEIQFNSLVKMNTLVLDYLNSEMKSVPDDLFEFCDEKIRLAIANSFQEVDNINRYFDKKHINICKEPYAYLISACEKCNSEVFNYWGYCNWCNSQSQTSYQSIYCPKCFIEHDSICYKKEYFYLFFKYSDTTLQLFLKRLDNRRTKEDFFDEKQKEISNYSILGKEIASKENIKMEKRLKENQAKFTSYNHFLSVLMDKNTI